MNGDITVSVGGFSNDITFSTGPDCGCEKKGFNVSVAEDSQITLNGNYNKLKNKPSINGVTLAGSLSLTDLSLRAIYYATTDEWAENPVPVTEKGALYIYSDFVVYRDEDGREIVIPGLKIGDGRHSLEDLEFANEGGGSGGTSNYNALRNKPKIGGVTLEGDKTLEDLGLQEIHSGTAAEWADRASEISVDGAVYIYQDLNPPVIRIGDGVTEIGNLPEMKGYDSDTAKNDVYSYLLSLNALVSEEDRSKWGKTLDVALEASDPELIVFSYVG